MKKFCFYSKRDSSKEKLGCGTYPNKLEAIMGFAQLKQLPVNKFQELFEVTPYER
jgi:hypothetical protein